VRLAQKAKAPIDAFLSIQAASGIVLLLAAVVALIWANSPWRESYFSLFQTEVGIHLGPWSFTRSLAWVVNDGLMVIFFFVVGLEIRREIHEGELSELKRASLPLAAALGGMLLPALIYHLLVKNPEAKSGWGVPMATDIAFAVGVLALLGKRCPPALRVLLLALAVIDDLGAILVIAIFYSDDLSLMGFVVGALGFALTILQQRLGVRSKLAYIPAGVLAWAGIYASGVHPTIAGVLLGLLTPIKAWFGREGFVRNVSNELNRIEGDPSISTHSLETSLRAVNTARREALSPAESLIQTLHSSVAFGIMPVFALANAGVVIDTGAISGASLEVSLAVAAGLVLGKPLGVLVMCGLFVKLGWAILPARIGFRELLVLGLVAGIGFTMSLFIAELAFNDAMRLGAAKIGVLAASVFAGLLGALVGRFLLKPRVQAGADSAFDAECSTEH